MGRGPTSRPLLASEKGRRRINAEAAEEESKRKRTAAGRASSQRAPRAGKRSSSYSTRWRVLLRGVEGCGRVLGQQRQGLWAAPSETERGKDVVSRSVATRPSESRRNHRAVCCVLAQARRGGRRADRHTVRASSRSSESGGGGRDFSREGSAGVAGAADSDQFACAGADAGAGSAGKLLPAGERVLAGAVDDCGGGFEPVAAKGDGEYAADCVALASEQDCEPFD